MQDTPAAAAFPDDQSPQFTSATDGEPSSHSSSQKATALEHIVAAGSQNPSTAHDLKPSCGQTDVIRAAVDDSDTIIFTEEDDEAIRDELRQLTLSPVRFDDVTTAASRAPPMTQTSNRFALLRTTTPNKSDSPPSTDVASNS